jgi:exodeoxyribonuclease VII small subunit
MKLEENIKELEELLKTLEKGELPLEEAVELYSKGMKLTAECKNEIEKAKLTVNEVQL